MVKQGRGVKLIARKKMLKRREKKPGIVVSKPLLAWKEDSNGEGVIYSFEPIFSERAIYHDGKIHSLCTLCGQHPNRHRGERKEETGFLEAICPDVGTDKLILAA